MLRPLSLCRTSRRMSDLSTLRTEYSSTPLSESSLPALPQVLIRKWLDDAISAELKEPSAMCLSTCDPTTLQPSARIVLLKGLNIDSGDMFFYTNYESKKGNELAVNPRAALTLFWADFERSVRVEGVVERIPESESAEYFAKRPRGAQIGAWASCQSRQIDSRDALHEQYATEDKKWKDCDVVQKPPHWGGYVMKPSRIEFWKGRSDRFHDRVEYTRNETEWDVRRLQP